MLHHFDSFADLQTHMATEAQYYVSPSEALTGSIRDMMEETRAAIVLEESVEAVRYRRRQ